MSKNNLIAKIKKMNFHDIIPEKAINYAIEEFEKMNGVKAEISDDQLGLKPKKSQLLLFFYIPGAGKNRWPLGEIIIGVNRKNKPILVKSFGLFEKSCDLEWYSKAKELINDITQYMKIY